MAAGMEFPGSDKAAGVRLEIPATDVTSIQALSSSPPRMPKRLRDRLECKTPSHTVGEIEAKLRGADLRRQKFHEELSSKARRNMRSPLRDSPHEEDLGQRLEAKLQAAERKRLSMLNELQTRLARLDKSRQAAKTWVEMRFENKREKLGSKVESRFLQAKENRMLILTSYGQRRATIRERRSQSLMRRVLWESKYKERVRAAIYQKRAAAERNRLRLLDDEKKRTQARLLQVFRVAKSVNHQREIQRRRMEDQLEDRLQRARRQRAEFLRQKVRSHGSVHVNWVRMNKHADYFSRKIARCWRQFLNQKKTTLALAKAYNALKINERAVKSMPFEQFAHLIESNATIQTVNGLLDRFECRFKLLQSVVTTPGLSALNNIDHLLKSVASPRRKSSPRNTNRSRVTKRPGSKEAGGAKLSRYQVRVLLCAYMILGHADAVFSEKGEREISLARLAGDFVREFELLVKIILDGYVPGSNKDNDAAFPRHCCTFRSQLVVFDRAWCAYLSCFVLWKAKDVKSLEEDLVRAACQLELSMIQTCKLTPEGDGVDLTHDMKAIQKQVTDDQKLLRDKLRHLSGDSGIEHMEHAISDTRSKFFQAKEKKSPLGTPVTDFPTPRPRCSPLTAPGSCSAKLEDNERSGRVVRSLFQNSASSSKRIFLFDNQANSSGEHIALENELIVNEVIHDQHLSLADTFKTSAEDENSIMGKIRVTMRKAFWDGIIEPMKQDEPSYDRVIGLVKEVREELSQIAPRSWKQEIFESIDLDILSQVLRPGVLDMNYLRKILDFALVTLQKLSAPATDDKMKATHKKLLMELTELCQSRDSSDYSHVIAMVKGLQFVLEQIQIVKQEISKARIKTMEPLLKGPAGLDYLKTCFANHYGPPSHAPNSLPATAAWISSVRDARDQEWSAHSSLKSHIPSKALLPLTPLKTGVRHQNERFASQGIFPNTTGDQQLECKGGEVDLSVRIGLLKLVSMASSMMEENLPETLNFNLHRLKHIAAKVQNIVVISTSILIYQQVLLSEHALTNPADREILASKFAEKLWEGLSSTSNNSRIKETIKIINEFSKDDAGDRASVEKLQSRNEIMERMVTRSLQDGDAVYMAVSRAVHLAMRGVVLGGIGTKGRVLAEMALRKVGAGVLALKVVEAGEVLAVMADVSAQVHGQWYEHLV